MTSFMPSPSGVMHMDTENEYGVYGSGVTDLANACPGRKKFASPERRVGETLHVANDFVRCLSHCVGEAFQNLFYAQKQLIDITYIQKLSTFFKIL